MSFIQQKTDVLSRLDKSKKGSIDEPIRELIDLINSYDQYYTSSSCSGRIFLMSVGERKNESNWLYVTHNLTDYETVLSHTQKLPQQDVWFSAEPLILHICCKDLESAKLMITHCQQAGFRRSAIVTLTNRIMIEVVGTDRLDTLVARSGSLLITENYLRILVEEANKKLARNLSRISRLYTEIKKIK